METNVYKFKKHPNEKCFLKTLELFFECIKENDLKSATKYVVVTKEKLIENLSILFQNSIYPNFPLNNWSLTEKNLSNVSFDKSDINFQYENENIIKSIDLGVLYNNKFDGIGAVFNVKRKSNYYFLELDCFKIW